MVVKMQDDLLSIGVKKGLPFTKFLNHELNKLRGSGVLQNILAIPTQTCPLDEKTMPITFHKMIFLFTALVLGVILSIITFIIEKAILVKKFSTSEKIEANMGDGLKPRSNKQIKIETTTLQDINQQNLIEGTPIIIEFYTCPISDKQSPCPNYDSEEKVRKHIAYFHKINFKDQMLCGLKIRKNHLKMELLVSSF